ncbi:MAG: NUDIX hydrolase [Bowdeniella nasicola]|nr:NUDIX hydrolase [Bowdeniella nasicola]
MGTSASHDCDRWVNCRCGARHWGANGAAGLLLWRIDPTTGATTVLLQHRAAFSHHGGTWGLPGGALTSGEQAVTGALREAAEEACISPHGVRVWATSRLQHPDWSYTTVIGEDIATMQVAIGDRESIELAWVPVARVQHYPLLPAFARAWSTLQRYLRPFVILAAEPTATQLTGCELSAAPFGLSLQTIFPVVSQQAPNHPTALVFTTGQVPGPLRARPIALEALCPVD